jgi:hypothetical protein
MKRELDCSKARRGPLVPTDPHKTRVTVWLDTKLVDYLMSIVDRAGGGSYEDLINELLRQRISSHRSDAVSKNLPARVVGNKLLIALKILDSDQAANLRSHAKGHLKDSGNGGARRVQRNKKTHGGKAVRLFDFDAQ